MSKLSTSQISPASKLLKLQASPLEDLSSRLIGRRHRISKVFQTYRTKKYVRDPIMGGLGHDSMGLNITRHTGWSMATTMSYQWWPVSIHRTRAIKPRHPIHEFDFSDERILAVGEKHMPALGVIQCLGKSSDK